MFFFAKVVISHTNTHLPNWKVLFIEISDKLCRWTEWERHSWHIVMIDNLYLISIQRWMLCWQSQISSRKWETKGVPPLSYCYLLTNTFSVSSRTFRVTLLGLHGSDVAKENKPKSKLRINGLLPSSFKFTSRVADRKLVELNWSSDRTTLLCYILL